jgi:hypothetical protein
MSTPTGFMILARRKDNMEVWLYRTVSEMRFYKGLIGQDPNYEIEYAGPVVVRRI